MELQSGPKRAPSHQGGGGGGAVAASAGGDASDGRTQRRQVLVVPDRRREKRAAQRPREPLAHKAPMRGLGGLGAGPPAGHLSPADLLGRGCP